MKRIFMISFSLFLLNGCGENGDSGFPSRPDISETEWQAPDAQLLDIDGSPLVGSTLQGRYFFVDPNTPPRPEGLSELLWRDNKDSIISQGDSLDLTEEMVGKRLVFCVIPVAQGTSQTHGEEHCSLPIVVIRPTGHAPEALSISFSPEGTLTVGDTVTGSYIYQDADPEDHEGRSNYSWLADGVDILGANAKNLTLSSLQQGTKLSFCVRPASVPRDPHNNPTTGQRRCSNVSNTIIARAGQAPEVARLAVLGWATVGNTLQGSYLYQDEDGDKEDTSIQQWKRDGTVIPGSTGKAYLLGEKDLGTVVGYCVTPVARTGLPNIGLERCTTIGPVVSTPDGIPPTATPAISVTSGGWPQAGSVLSGSYQYHPSTTARPEGNSISFWRTEDQDQICSSQPCDYTINNRDIGLTIQYCIVPIDNAGLSGTLACKQVTGAAISIHGHLEYNRNLYAHVIGLTGTSRWLVDTSNILGPEHNGNMREPLGAFHIPSYRIGTSLYAALRAQLGYSSNAVSDKNGDGMLDNREWAEAISTNMAPSIDARHFVGKDVKYCLQTTEYGEICLSASESRGVADSLCQDSTLCVVGGIYYDASNPLKRGIAPVTRLLIAGNNASGNPIVGSAYFHRPLSKAETSLKDQIGIGSEVPDSGTSGNLNQGGISWALFNHATPSLTSSSPALRLCRQLTDGEPVGSWSLPVESNDYYTDSHAAPNGDNQAPTDTDLNLLSFWQLRFGGQITPLNQLDPLFGWPKKEIWSATSSSIGTHKVINWQSGSSANLWLDTSPFLVSCIQ